jgi:hypothetical protein
MLLLLPGLWPRSFKCVTLHAASLSVDAVLLYAVEKSDAKAKKRLDAELDKLNEKQTKLTERETKEISKLDQRQLDDKLKNERKQLKAKERQLDEQLKNEEKWSKAALKRKPAESSCVDQAALKRPKPEAQDRRTLSAEAIGIIERMVHMRTENQDELEKLVWNSFKNDEHVEYKGSKPTQKAIVCAFAVWQLHAPFWFGASQACRNRRSKSCRPINC